MARTKHVSLFVYGRRLLLWSIWLSFIYYHLAFRVVPELTLQASKIVLWTLTLVLPILCAIFTPHKRRTLLSSLLSFPLPAGIYFTLSYQDIYPTFLRVLLLCLLIALVLYAALIIGGFIHRLLSGGGRPPLWRFIASFVHRLKTIAGIFLAPTLCFFLALLLLGSPLLKPKVRPVSPRSERVTIADNIDTILLLQEDIWSDLSAQDRINVLQVVANIEASYLGLPHELNLSADVLDEYTVAMYTDSTHSIFFNVDYITLVTAEDAVSAIAHEAYHAYERRLVDLMLDADPSAQSLRVFNRIRTYHEEFVSYIDPYDDLQGYENQAVELDSDSYGLSAVTDYFDAINEHLNTTP